MTEIAAILAKLSGIKKSLAALIDENVSRGRSAGQTLTRTNFPQASVEHYFTQAHGHVERLRQLLPDLFSDFQAIPIEPDTAMSDTQVNYSRTLVLRLIRDIDQIFEIRANSQLAAPEPPRPQTVFISHGRSQDWRQVQPFIERDVGIPTVELAQEPSRGRTIIEKLEDNSGRCDSAVIVMTGDDVANEEESRVRENVMHEIGFFQGRYGRHNVVLLHEEGVSVPSNLGGIVYVPFPTGSIDSSFAVLHRELRAIYGG